MHQILSNGGSNDGSIAVVYTNEKKTDIGPLKMSRTVKASVRALGLEKQDIMAHIVHKNYLQAGGTMTLNLSGNIDTLIMKFG